MGPIVDWKIKTSDARIPLLYTKFEVNTSECNELAEYCYGILDEKGVIE